MGYVPPPAAVAVDLVVLTIREDDLCAVIVERAPEPFRGKLALPGGFVLPHEDLETAAARELREETRLDCRKVAVHLEQLGAYGDPDRDPRARVVSVAYLALAPDLPVPTGGSDAASASWVPVSKLRGPSALAFDHWRILTDGLERARSKLEDTPLATAFCAAEFTIAELRHVYEVVWGVTLDPRNFQRKVTEADGFVVPTGTRTRGERGRPAQLYRAGTAQALWPPIVRRKE